MVTIPLKPLSVNKCWRGRRFKTEEYKNYEIAVGWLLPEIKLPKPPYKVTYEFGFSSKASDIDNPIKPFTDILQKHYGFNDKLIYELHVTRKNVKKDKEYIKFKIESL